MIAGESGPLWMPDDQIEEHIVSPRSQMPLARILARDRRGAAIHEAGHFVVATALGFDFKAKIWPHDGDPLREKTWIGQARTIPTVRNKKIIFPTKHQNRMIGCAGAIAELLWLDGLEYYDGLSLCDSYFEDLMSATDWAMCGCEPGFPDRALYRAVEKAEAILKDRYSELLTTARLLIKDGIADSTYLKYIMAQPRREAEAA